MGDNKKATPAAKAASKTSDRRNGKAYSKVAERRRIASEELHKQNRAVMRHFGLKDETTERTVTKVIKQGKKTVLKTTTVTANKSPSKLVRKERRRLDRINLGHKIDEVTQKLDEAQARANA